MIMAGKSVTDREDTLKKITIDYVYHAIKNPNPEVAAKIRMLRQLKNIDKEQYARQKRKLPYIVCAHFNPPYRKKDNFARVKYFILDIDHVTEKHLTVNELKSKLQNDSRIVLGFASPGEDGLKLLFQLSDYCYDPMQYAVFYKQFASAFSDQYGLDQVLDTKTHDVSRACFVSSDPQAWYNPQADMIKFANYIDLSDTLFISEQFKEIKSDQKETAAQLPDPVKQGMTDDIYAAIRQKLNPGKFPKKEKNIFVPEEIHQITESIQQKFQEYEIKVTEIRNIHYGKKFSLQFQLQKAEINLFYGKNGFRIVESPKNGTDPKLNHLAAQIAQEVLNDVSYPEI